MTCKVLHLLKPKPSSSFYPIEGEQAMAASVMSLATACSRHCPHHLCWQGLRLGHLHEHKKSDLGEPKHPRSRSTFPVSAFKSGHREHNRVAQVDNKFEGARQSRDDSVQRVMEASHEGKQGPPLRVLPLGGLGEIGMNCMLVGHYDRYIMIDAGLMFPDFDDLGVAKILPDTSFIHRWRGKIEAVIITHGHEDHIGALPWVVPALDPGTKIYSTSFTHELIVRRLKEYNLEFQDRCQTFNMRERFKAGPFEIESVRVTHSIPDCCGLILRCEDGTIFHSGDWKIDETPVDGNEFDRTGLEELSKEGVTLMMSDSTNVLSPGRTISEADVAKSLMSHIMDAKGRVITTQFASNIHRLGSVKAAADATGRKLVFIGASLKTYFDAAWRDNQAPFDPSVLVKAEDMEAYSPSNLLIVTTGSQAEPRAALNLASFGQSRGLKLNKDDLILYSAKMIPGNETRVIKMMNRVAELGPTIRMGRGQKLHTSGHAYHDELEEVLRLVKPQHFLPVHGEFAFLKEHERLGKSTGIHHTAVIRNGEMLGVSHLRSRRVLSSGFSTLGKKELKLMYNDGNKAFGTAAELRLEERMHIALDGLIVVSVEIRRNAYDDDDDDQESDGGYKCGLKARIRITTRCLWLDGGKVMETLYRAANGAVGSCRQDAAPVTVERTVGTVLRKVMQKYNNKRPDVIVIATEGYEKKKMVQGKGSLKTDAKAQVRVMVTTKSVKKKVAEQIEEPEKTGFVIEAKAIPPTDEVEEKIVMVTMETPSEIAKVDKTEQRQVDTENYLSVPFKEVSDIDDLEEDEPLKGGAAAAKRPKWKHKELLKLIEVRTSLERQFEEAKLKTPLWKQVASILTEHGFEHSHNQCKSMWGSLKRKYEDLIESKEDENILRKRWPYFDMMHKAISPKGSI